MIGDDCQWWWWGGGVHAGKRMSQMLSEDQKMALAKALDPAGSATDLNSAVPLDVSITVW